MREFLQILLCLVFFLPSCGNKSSTITSVELAGTLPQVEGLTPPIPVGATEKFQAIAVYDDKHWEDKTAEATFSTNMECPTDSNPGSSGNSIATVSSDGTVTGVAGGTVYLVATYSGFIGCTKLTISGAALVSIDVTPPAPSIVSGTTQQFVATGTFADGTVRDITTSVAWASASASVASIVTSGAQTGLATGRSAGVVQMIATVGAIAGTATLTVTAAPLVSIEVTPTLPSIALGLTKQFTATGVYADNSTQNITNTVTWTSTDVTVATVNAAGLASSLLVGSTTITATSGAISGTSVLTVTPASLASLTIAPANPSIALGLNRQFTATGNYTDGSQQDLTNTVVWASVDTGVATISNGGGTNGLASSVSVGTTTIVAASGSVSTSTSLTVTSASLVSLAVTPALPSIAKGLTQQFVATGTYTDGSTADITTSVVWSTSDATVATVSNALGSKGLASGAGVGTATITATSGAIFGDTDLTVTAAVLQSIVVTPAGAFIGRTQTRQYTATGTYSDSSTLDITASVTWSSSSPATATISNAGGSNGLATGVAIGAVTFRATLSGVIGAANATVTP